MYSFKHRLVSWKKSVSIRFLKFMQAISWKFQTQLENREFTQRDFLVAIANRNKAHLILNVRKEVLILFFSRILHLCKLVQHFGKSLTPLQFVYHQFNSGMEFITYVYNHVRPKCQAYSMPLLYNLITQGLNLLVNDQKLEIGFALDEASVTAKQFKE